MVIAVSNAIFLFRFGIGRKTMLGWDHVEDNSLLEKLTGSGRVQSSNSMYNSKLCHIQFLPITHSVKKTKKRTNIWTLRLS